jgi:thymidylate synthase
MRSADVALGVPFNIASYALLTHMIARITNITPGEVVVSMCDCHLYVNHLEGIAKQLERNPVNLPTFRFSNKVVNPTIDDFAFKYDYTDFIVEDYYPHPSISLHMAV